jgi:hypothetical protein
MRFGAPLLAALFFATEARAQLHWDASAQAGVSRRFLAQSVSGEDPSFGPVGQLAGHVALLPLVRAGAYAGVERSPLGSSGRNIGFAGARAKGIIPGLQGPVRAWVFAGVGYARAYGESRIGGTQPRLAPIPGAWGGFLEVPFGLGASYTFFKPWAIVVELGARVGVAHGGALYDGPDGLDRFGLGLLVGILYDR